MSDHLATSVGFEAWHRRLVVLLLPFALVLAGCQGDRQGEEEVSWEPAPLDSAEVERRADTVMARAERESIPLSRPRVVRAVQDTCQVVVANGIAGTTPGRDRVGVIRAPHTPGDTANAARDSFNSLSQREQDRIRQAVRDRTLDEFVCTGQCRPGRVCTKDVELSTGTGRVPDASGQGEEDLFIVQGDRVCECRSPSGNTGDGGGDGGTGEE